MIVNDYITASVAVRRLSAFLLPKNTELIRNIEKDIYGHTSLINALKSPKNRDIKNELQNPEESYNPIQPAPTTLSSPSNKK